jgi:hypothetical protein
MSRAKESTNDTKREYNFSIAFCGKASSRAISTISGFLLVAHDVHESFARAIGVDHICASTVPLVDQPVKTEGMRNSFVNEIEVLDCDLERPWPLKAIALHFVNTRFALPPIPEREFDFVDAIAVVPGVVNASEPSTIVGDRK